MNSYLRTMFASLWTIAALLLVVGCGSALEVGIEPEATATPAPLPTFTPAPTARIYASQEYGFAFEYLDNWALSEDANQIELTRGPVVLRIVYRRLDEPVNTAPRTGLPAGEVVYGGKIRFLGATCPREVLQYENKDKAVFYNGIAPISTAYGLEFLIWLEDLNTDYMALDLPDEAQAEADQIVQSFVITDPQAAAPEPNGGQADDPSQAAGAPAGQGQEVIGWMGKVVGAPEGAGYDDRLVLAPEGAGEVGVLGATAEIESEIARLRDLEGAGEYAHFWGTLTCSDGEQVVDDYGGCQLWVTRLATGQALTELEPVVDGWTGQLIGNPAGAQFDDYFLLAGEFGVGYGIHSLDPEVQQQLESLRDAGRPLRVWGGLRVRVPDAFGSQIQVDRIEVVQDVEADPYPGWGTFVQDPYGFSFRYPPSWTAAEAPGQEISGGGRLADAVTLTQDKLQITVQYKRLSEGEIGWQGLSGPYALATPSDQVLWLGQEVQRMIWVYDEATKAIEVNLADEDRDLGLMVTLRDGTVLMPDDPQAAPITKAAIQDLDLVLGSFAYTEFP